MMEALQQNEERHLNCWQNYFHKLLRLVLFKKKPIYSPAFYHYTLRIGGS